MMLSQKFLSLVDGSWNIWKLRLARWIRWCIPSLFATKSPGKSRRMRSKTFCGRSRDVVASRAQALTKATRCCCSGYGGWLWSGPYFRNLPLSMLLRSRALQLQSVFWFLQMNSSCNLSIHKQFVIINFSSNNYKQFPTSITPSSVSGWIHDLSCSGHHCSEWLWLPHRGDLLPPQTC